MPHHPAVSDTTRSLTAYVFTALRERILAHPGPLYRLHIGDTWREPLEAARAEAWRTEDHPGLHRYSPVHGEAALLAAARRKVLRRAGVDLALDDLQVCSGATAGLSIVCQALLDPGDEVLVLAPFWPLIRGIVASRGAVPVEVPFLDRLDAPGFDPEAALEAAVTDRTVALYVNTPHNPTGRILPDDVCAALARVARRHGLWMLSDEVYEDLWLGDARPTPFWARPDVRDRALAVHSMSKGYGLAGARVGYIHGPSEAMRAVRAVQTFQAYCAAKPMQLGAAAALDEGDAWLEETRALYGDAGRRAAEALGIPTPEGGTFLFFDASPWLDGADTSLPFLERCLDAGVVLTPGAASGQGYERWVRVCFTTLPPAELDEALDRLRAVLGGGAGA